MKLAYDSTSLMTAWTTAAGAAISPMALDSFDAGR
jgi:hypothetical protein